MTTSTSLSASEQFPALAAVPGLSHGFTRRVPGLEMRTDRETALQRLRAGHAELRARAGLGGHRFATARQVHGATVARVLAEAGEPEADGLITDDPAVCLGIYVADCGAVYLVDPVQRALGLIHSGRKGTELGITAVAVRRLQEEYGSRPEDLMVQLGPCIRPPFYEVDFAAEIVRTARAAGVRQVHDCGLCTAAAPETYYSYRREQGQTGRMLAFLAWA